MRQLKVDHRVFKVNDFLSWQKQGALVLSPSFQRRPVWDKIAKSFLLDTILRGLPVPVIYIRERLDLDAQQTIREVVDGQQRLRTLFGFIDLYLLEDATDRDDFRIARKHNSELANKTFTQLDIGLKSQLLEYEFSVNVFPSEVEDRDLLQIFARLNSTGYRLTSQELRNAEFFGSFKTVMYNLALEQLDRWREWRIFNEQEIARMAEVEFTSDLCISIEDGIYGKSKAKIDRFYRNYDDEYAYGDEVARRFRLVMDTIEKVLGDHIANTVYRREVFFYSMYMAIYDLMWGLTSSLSVKSRPRTFEASAVRAQLLEVSDRFEKKRVPEEFRDAVDRASADVGRRMARHQYISELLASG